jgi:hypothetical protein
MYRERAALGERLELRLVDGRTGEVKRHLVVAGGVCVDVRSDWSLALEIQRGRELLNELVIDELLGGPG